MGVNRMVKHRRNDYNYAKKYVCTNLDQVNVIKFNSNYQNNAVYNSCSYNVNEAITLNRPVITYECYDCLQYVSKQEPIDEKHATIVQEGDVKDDVKVIEVIPCTDGDVLPKIDASIQRKITNKLTKILWPRQLCVCYGGCDSETSVPGVRERRRMAEDSFETIELNNISRTLCRSLDIEPSVMSIIQMYGHSSKKKSPKIMRIFMKAVLSNSFKNINSFFRKSSRNY